MHAIKLRKDGVEIDGRVYKIGDVLRATNEKGKIIHEGVVRFKKYDDGEGYADYCHLGFVVEDPGCSVVRYTLIDLVESGWKIEKVGKYEE